MTTNSSMTVLMAEAEARLVTRRIQSALDRLATDWAELVDLVADAHSRRADLALGYDSWGEYVQAELTTPHELASNLRSQVVGVLSARGLSDRAIAPVVGVSKSQVSRDIQVSRNGTPELPSQTAIRREAVHNLRSSGATQQVIADQLGVNQATISRDLRDAEPEPDLRDEDFPHLAGDAFEKAVVFASTVPPVPGATIGLDGKTYKKPAVASPRRRPFADGWRDATLDLSKLIERIERLTTDDRFPSNKDEIARYANDLIRARDALAGVIEQFN